MHLRMHMSNPEVDELQQQNAMSGSTPVNQELKSEGAVDKVSPKPESLRLEKMSVVWRIWISAEVAHGKVRIWHQRHESMGRWPCVNSPDVVM